MDADPVLAAGIIDVDRIVADVPEDGRVLDAIGDQGVRLLDHDAIKRLGK